MKKILVTGGAGFVGRHLVARLLEAGHLVHVVDSLLIGSGACDPTDGWPLFEPRDYKGFRFSNQDCREFFQLCCDEDFDYVFHLAACVGGRASIENRPFDIADNFGVDAAFWSWATKVRPSKVVCMSSSAVYPISLQSRGCGTHLSEPLLDLRKAPDSIGVPDGTYGWAKVLCEYLAVVAWQREGLQSVILRPFSGYGEDQSVAYPVPAICLRALTEMERGGKVLDIWGDGTQVRDFVHIEDCVTAILSIVDKVSDAAAVNISTGVGISMLQLGELVTKTCGWDATLRPNPNRPQGVHTRVGDRTLQSALGVQHVIPLDQGVQRVLEHQRIRENGYRS